MANWIILTGADIRLLDTEKTIMQGVTPLQNLDTVVTSACNYVRGYLAGGGNIMEPAPAVPPEVKDDVVAIARYRYLAQEPTGTLISPTRQKEYDDALAHLRDIAKDIAAVTQGDMPPGDFGSGKWGSATRIAMRTEAVPPVGTQSQTKQGVWKFSSSTSMTDPGAGMCRNNSAGQASTTQLAIARMTNDNVDSGSVLGSLGIGDGIDVQDETNVANSMHFTISVIPTNNGTWFLIPVAFASGAGVEPSNNALLSVTFTY